MTFEAGVELPLYLSDGLRNVAAVHDSRDLKFGIVEYKLMIFAQQLIFMK